MAPEPEQRRLNRALSTGRPGLYIVEGGQAPEGSVDVLSMTERGVLRWIAECKKREPQHLHGFHALDAMAWGQLNVHRENIYHAGLVLVCHMSEQDIVQMIEHAPDLWAWRHGPYNREAEEMTMQENQGELLAVFVPGPNEYHAMPDMKTALDQSARLNSTLENDPKIRETISSLGLDVEQMKSSVCKWPYSDAEHAEDLEIFRRNNSK